MEHTFADPNDALAQDISADICMFVEAVNNKTINYAEYEENRVDEGVGCKRNRNSSLHSVSKPLLQSPDDLPQDHSEVQTACYVNNRIKRSERLVGPAAQTSLEHDNKQYDLSSPNPSVVGPSSASAFASMSKRDLISLLGNTGPQINDDQHVKSKCNVPYREGDLDFYPKPPNQVVSFSVDEISKNWMYRSEHGDFIQVPFGKTVWMSKWLLQKKIIAPSFAPVREWQVTSIRR